jgi:hypothetical protein
VLPNQGYGRTQGAECGAKATFCTCILTRAKCLLKCQWEIVSTSNVILGYTVRISLLSTLVHYNP